MVRPGDDGQRDNRNRGDRFRLYFQLNQVIEQCFVVHPQHGRELHLTILLHLPLAKSLPEMLVPFVEKSIH